MNLSLLSDEAIIGKIVKGNHDLYEQIIQRYQSKLLKYAQYLIKDYHQASDVVQNTFIKAYVNLNSFNSQKKFSSWLYRIAHNEAMNIVKKHHRETPLLDHMDFESNIDLEDDLIKKELQRKTHQCLDQLNIIYKEPLALYFLQDKSYQEISDILRIPISTVSTRISRAKTYMKKYVKKNYKFNYFRFGSISYGQN